jgi:hypothetical protein
MYLREPARKLTNAGGGWGRSGVSRARHMGNAQLAGGSRRARHEGKNAEQSEPAAGSGIGFSFTDIPVFPSAQTRALSTPVKPSCACAGTCAKCRNPQRRSVTGDSEGLTRDEAMETHAPKAMTRNGDGGGGAGGGGAGAGGAAAGGGGAAAAPARSARLASGPRYTPNGSLTPVTAGGRRSVSFDFDAVFASDPAAGVFPGCGEIHQDIKWNAAAAASMTALGFPNPVPHGGFPAGHPANVWIEDRDDGDMRYGRRTGPHSDPSAGDQYTTAGVQDMLHGATYHGEDGPDMPAAHTGRWTFMVLAFDNCNHGVQIGSADFITIDW